MLFNIAMVAVMTYTAFAIQPIWKSCAETKDIPVNGLIGGWEKVDPKSANDKLQNAGLAKIIAEGLVTGAWMQTVNGDKFLFQTGSLDVVATPICNAYYKDLQGVVTNKGQFWPDLVKPKWQSCAQMKRIPNKQIPGGWRQVTPEDANGRLKETGLDLMIAAGEIKNAWVQTVNGMNFMFQEGSANSLDAPTCHTYFKDFQGMKKKTSQFRTNQIPVINDMMPRWISCLDTKGIKIVKGLSGGWKRLPVELAINKVRFPAVSNKPITDAWIQTVNGDNILLQQGNLFHNDPVNCLMYYKERSGKVTAVTPTYQASPFPKATVEPKPKPCIIAKNIPGGWKKVSVADGIQKLVKSNPTIGDLKISDAWLQVVNGYKVMLQIGSFCELYEASSDGVSKLNKVYNVNQKSTTVSPTPNPTARSNWKPCIKSKYGNGYPLVGGWKKVNVADGIKKIDVSFPDVSKLDVSDAWVQLVNGYNVVLQIGYQCRMYQADFNGIAKLSKTYSVKPKSLMWQSCNDAKGISDKGLLGGWKQLDTKLAVEKFPYEGLETRDVTDAWEQVVGGLFIWFQFGDQHGDKPVQCILYFKDLNGREMVMDRFETKQIQAPILPNPSPFPVKPTHSEWKPCVAVNNVLGGWKKVNVADGIQKVIKSFPGINALPISNAWIQVVNGYNVMVQVGSQCRMYQSSLDGVSKLVKTFDVRSAVKKIIKKWTPCHVTKKIYDRGLMGGWRHVSSEVAVNKVRYPGLRGLPITDAWMQTVNGDNILIQQGNLSDDVPLNCMVFYRSLSGKVTLAHQFQSQPDPVYFIWKMVSNKWNTGSGGWGSH